MQDYKLMIAGWVRREVDGWFRIQGMDLTMSHFLWYKESKPGSNGKLKISAKRPSDDWLIAGDGEPMKIDWSVECAVYNLCNWCSNLPILDPSE